jgi:hypothetical protein
MVEHILEQNSAKGAPRKVTTNIVGLIKDYHKRNFRMRPLRKWESVINDKRTPIAVNYALSEYNYRYINNFMTNYNRWYNLMSTVWTTVNTLATKYQRQHFIHITLPEALPAIQDLRRAEGMLDSNSLPDKLSGVGSESWAFTESKEGDISRSVTLGLESYKEAIFPDIGLEAYEETRNDFISFLMKNHILTGTGLEAMTRPVLELFSSREMLMFLDLFTWLGDNRERSVLSKVNVANLDKINLVFIEGGKISILNLGLLDSVRAKTKVLERNQLHPKQTQRLFLRYIERIVQLRTSATLTDEEIDNAITDEEDEESKIGRAHV